jgi:hypothetical protein
MIDNVVRHSLLGQVSSLVCYHALERVSFGASAARAGGCERE